MQAGAHARAVRAARAEAAGGRRVRVAGAAATRAPRPRARASRSPPDAPREPQREGGRAQATLVRLRCVRGQSSSPQETLKRG